MPLFRTALRTWRQTPALAAIVVVVLALGIGTTTTVFALAYSVLIRPFPFPAAERLVWITTYDTRAADAAEVTLNSNRMPIFAHWREHLRSFERLAAWSGTNRPDVYTVAGAGTPERVSGLRVTQQLFPLVGGQPAIGSLFREGDDRIGASPTVVLSHGYWLRRFGGRDDVVGQRLTVENEPHMVIGVLDERFVMPGSLFAGATIDLYLPLVVDPDEDIGGFMAVLGRLAPGVSVDQAQAELSVAQRTMAVGRWEWMSVLAQRVVPLSEPITGEARSPLVLLLAGIGCVLLIACANVANLLLVRASGRRREMQVRTALGATVRHVLRQTLAESALVAAAGGSAGLVLAFTLIGWLRGAPWLSLARSGELAIGASAFAFALTLCVAATLAFGTLPLLHLRRRDLLDALRPHGGGVTDHGAARVQRTALAAQIAFALILTAAGALLARSFIRLIEVDPGFSTQGVVALRVDPAGRLAGPERLPFFARVLEEISVVPGVESAALAINLPLDRNMGWDAIPPGRAPDPRTDSAAGRIVSPGYFRTVGIPVLEGRDFDGRDRRGGALVMAINETFARRLRAEGGEPLRSRFFVLGNLRQVVAVVGDVRHESLERAAGQEVYIPQVQAPTFFQAYDLVVRAREPVALVPDLRAAIWRVDRNQAVGTPIDLQQLVDRSLAPRRLLTSVVGGFAVTALVIAALGVYGVVAYRVARRRKELAVRVALGAPGWRVTVSVLAETLTFVLLGLTAGVPLALGAGSAVRAYLFGIAAGDAATLAAACGAVLLIATTAAYVPARRSPRVDPIAALRTE